MEQPKTKTFAAMLGKVAPDSRRTLVVTAEYDPTTLMSSRNIANVQIKTAAEVNALDVINATRVVLQREALPKLEERLS